jgi:integrase
MSIKLRSKRLSDGSESFYLDIYYKGNRQYQFLDIKIRKNDPDRRQKKELAEKIRTKKEIELHSTIHDIPNFSNGGTDFIEYYNSKCKDDKYKASLSKFKEFIEEKMTGKVLPFNRVTEKLCEDYKDWLLKNLSNNTAWMYIIKLKTVLYKAVREKIIPFNPAKYVSVKFEEVEKIYLTYDELKKLNETETKYTLYKNAFLFACYTGLRISDIKALTWGQIRDGKIFFRQKKTKGVEYLPLSETAKKILDRMQKEVPNDSDSKIFDLKNKKTERIGEKIREWAIEAKVNKYITFHTARHTFATLSLSYGVDLYTVSKLLGHKSIKMTEIYAKIINEKTDEAVSKLPSL